MLKITIEGATFDELKNGVVALAQSLGGTVAASAAKPAAKAAAPKADAPKVPDFKTEVSPLVLKLADKSRPAAVELLSQFGVKKGVELKPEQYADFIVAANAAIEAADNDIG